MQTCTSPTEKNPITPHELLTEKFRMYYTVDRWKPGK